MTWFVQSASSLSCPMAFYHRRVPWRSPDARWGFNEARLTGPKDVPLPQIAVAVFMCVDEVGAIVLGGVAHNDILLPTHDDPTTRSCHDVPDQRVAVSTDEESFIYQGALVALQ